MHVQHMDHIISKLGYINAAYQWRQFGRDLKFKAGEDQGHEVRGHSKEVITCAGRQTTLQQAQQHLYMKTYTHVEGWMYW